MRPYLVILAGLLLLSCTALGIACGGDKETPGGTPAQPATGSGIRWFENFQTAAANAKDEGYEVYWLGREFHAGGLTFVGPNTQERHVDLEGVVESNYVESERQNLDLNIASYDRDTWALHEDQLYRNPNNTRRTAEIAGRDATIVSLGAGGHAAVIDFGDTVVLAMVYGPTPRTPGADTGNVLVDDLATFVRVLDELHPYPD